MDSTESPCCLFPPSVHPGLLREAHHFEEIKSKLLGWFHRFGALFGVMKSLWNWIEVVVVEYHE